MWLSWRCLPFRAAQAQTNDCTGSGEFSGGVCNRFDSTHLTNKYQFGDHFIKFTWTTVSTLST